MRKDSEGFWTVRSKKEFKGWFHLRNELFKQGVYKVHVKNLNTHPYELRIVLTDKENLPDVVNGVCV